MIIILIVIIIRVVIVYTVGKCLYLRMYSLLHALQFLHHIIRSMSLAQVFSSLFIFFTYYVFLIL